MCKLHEQWYMHTHTDIHRGKQTYTHIYRGTRAQTSAQNPRGENEERGLGSASTWHPWRCCRHTGHSWWGVQTCCKTPAWSPGSWASQSPPCTSTPAGCSAVDTLSTLCVVWSGWLLVVLDGWLLMVVGSCLLLVAFWWVVVGWLWRQLADWMFV